MAKLSNTIVSEIISHIINCNGKHYQDYYVGITLDPEDRLFIGHNVDENNGCYISRKAISDTEARKAEKALIAKGMKGGDGGGDHRSIYVYCYQITSDTRE